VGCIAETERAEGVGSSALALSVENSYVLALGDSLAAGHQLAPEEPGHCCGKDGYADQLHKALRAGDPKLRLRVLACGGETTATMIHGGGLCSYEHGSQLGEAIAWVKNKNLCLVTIDIGANDVLGCLQRPDAPPTCIPDAFTSVATNLTAILTTLREAIGPDVPIIGMNYYNPLIAQWLHGTEGARAAAIASQTSLVAPFNDLLEQVYSLGANAVADVESAFASANFTLPDAIMVEVAPGTSIPLSVANICAYTWMCGAGDIHPNTAGYALIAKAFQDELR
jgi:lysophospholipase L1-like esterase